MFIINIRTKRGVFFDSVILLSVFASAKVFRYIEDEGRVKVVKSLLFREILLKLNSEVVVLVFLLIV